MTITVTAHWFTVGDVEDPEIYAAEPIFEWQQTEAGKWVMEHSNPAPSFHQIVDFTEWGTRYCIKCYLTPENYTYWKLKYE
jgi:hypothetical protein